MTTELPESVTPNGSIEDSCEMLPDPTSPCYTKRDSCRLEPEGTASAMKNKWRVIGAVCVLVIAVYAYLAQSSILELLNPNPAESYYNLLVEGFRSGHLSLKKDVPRGLTQLADPYDTTANMGYQFPPYRMHDLSYYKGKLYLPWGITPALILLWPFTALTGKYLFHRQAVAIFCTVGFLASVGVLRALWRRYFAQVSVGAVATCALALGLATGVPMLLAQADVYEVAISCGYMLTMLTLAAIWCALHEPERGWRWLAAASVAYGLAVGARPTLLFGGIILLVPVVHARCERRRVWTLLIAATVPITLIGLGLMYYNFLRFYSPFEFGFRYQMGGQRQDTMEFFSLRYLWFNFRVYFLEPVRWKAPFPFVHGIVVPPVPKGHNGVGEAFGVFTNTPLVWLALAAPLVWRDRSPQAVSVLRWFVTAVGVFVGACAFTLGLVCAANLRYEIDFLPALLLLAVIGVLGLERVLAPTSESKPALRPVWRRAAQWGWGLLLGISVMFNLLMSVFYYAQGHYDVGTDLLWLGRVQEAIEQYERAVQINPDFAGAHDHLGTALMQAGKTQEAIQHYERAVQIKPDYAGAYFNLGEASAELRRSKDAIRHYEEALRIKPEYAEAHVNLGNELLAQGKLQDAIAHYKEALRIKPEQAEAHLNFGNALLGQGKLQDAMAHYKEALRIKPDYPQAHDNLGSALAQSGRLPEAMTHWEEALRLKPDDVEAHYNLGLALEKLGRTPEAIEQYEQVLKLRPDFIQARNALMRLGAGQ